jgi:hypothetical protein
MELAELGRIMYVRLEVRLRTTSVLRSKLFHTDLPNYCSVKYSTYGEQKVNALRGLYTARKATLSQSFVLRPTNETTEEHRNINHNRFLLPPPPPLQLAEVIPF